MEEEIIYFDGDCIICNTFIHYVAEHDDDYFKFKTQPNERSLNTKTDSIFLLKKGVLYNKSTAITHILLKCDLKAKFIAYLLMIVPKLIRDVGYDLFAKHRYKITKGKTCPIPSKNILTRLT
ncbi:MAG: thiol-disulfide oxidoreductase DCC family protein [Bacteroidota bacterium]